MGSAAAPSTAARLLKVLDIESSPCVIAGYGPHCQPPRQPRSARFFAKIVIMAQAKREGVLRFLAAHPARYICYFLQSFYNSGITLLTPVRSINRRD